MIGSWKIGAQLSTSHSFRDSLDPLGMVEMVRRVQEEIDLDLLIVGFREALRSRPAGRRLDPVVWGPFRY